MAAMSVSADSVRGPADHEVRDRILAAATEHFSRYGYAKTTVSDLAGAIGFSKAYVYKFFPSKQSGVAAMICANCLRAIEDEVTSTISKSDSAPEKLRQMFLASVKASLELFFEDRKLYEVAAAAAEEHWPPIQAHEERAAKRIEDVLRLGRQAGDFERKTPLDEAARGIYLVMRPYMNPPCWNEIWTPPTLRQVS